MTTYYGDTPPVPVPFHRWLLSLVIDHNPFYLLSALMMLFGVYTVNSTSEMKPGDLTKLLILLAILNVYELLVITLGRLLVWKPTVPRDGMTLLTLEALFFVDATFLNAETVMTRFTLGTLINIALLLLAILKSSVILKTMRIKVSPPLIAFLSLQLAALFLLPVVLKLNAWSDQRVDFTLYAAWWIAGLMPLAFDLLAKAFPSQMNAPADSPGKAQALRLVYVILPFISLVAHIGFMHWVYKADFFVAETAPILLGLAIALSRIPHPAITLFWRVALPIGAVVVALQNPLALQFGITPAYASVTPLRLTLVATYLTLAYVFFLHFMAYFLAGGAILAGIALFGPSAGSIVKFADECFALLKRLIPTTATAWGIVSIVCSFALLAVGAVVSWFSHHQRKAELLPAPPAIDPTPQES